MKLGAPLASWDSERLADWLELKALISADENASITDLVRELQRNGTTEERFPDEDDDDLSDDELEDEEDELDAREQRAMRLAEDAFAAIEDRKLACEIDGAYPFVIDSRSIQLRKGGLKSPYTFFLLLGEFGQKKGVKKGTKIFEHMCAWATRAYLGPKTLTAVFGFPRDVPNLGKGFKKAVDDLCSLISEGVRCRDSDKVRDEKDAGLDIVAWRSFPDRRVGKLIAFGQCATGDDWPSKTTELLPESWCGTWLAEAPAAWPVLRMFFLPYRVRVKDWDSVSRKAGLVFDRRRLAHCLALDPDADTVLADKWAEWTKELHEKLRAALESQLNVRVAS